jgi:hypothetical protein
MNDINNACTLTDCTAPLCPLDCHDKATWFPDEDICNSYPNRLTSWVKTQRKIRRLYLKGMIGDEYCFTLSIIQAIKQVKKGLRGIRPEDQYRNDTRPP